VREERPPSVQPTGWLAHCRAATLAAAGTAAQLDAAKAELSELRDTKMLRGDAGAVRRVPESVLSPCSAFQTKTTPLWLSSPTELWWQGVTLEGKRR
jgi:hypothetical protein